MSFRSTSFHFIHPASQYFTLCSFPPTLQSPLPNTPLRPTQMNPDIPFYLPQHFIPLLTPIFLTPTQLDPDNPFYLPQHLRDNPEELERVLQQKLNSTSPPGLQKETVNTLLEYVSLSLYCHSITYPIHWSRLKKNVKVTASFVWCIYWCFISTAWCLERRMLVSESLDMGPVVLAASFPIKLLSFAPLLIFF